jgi:hypothetical protein
VNRRFWHQAVRNNIEGPARLLTHTILQVPKGTLITRYSNVFFAFLLSGMSTWWPISMVAMSGRNLVLRLFHVQTVGIILEDGAQALCR